MASTQPAHDPALQFPPSGPTANQQPPGGQPPAPGAPQPNLAGNVLASMSPDQLAAILKHIPDILNRVRPSCFTPDRVSSRPAPPAASAFPAPRGSAGHALHVIEGIGHVRRGDRGGMRARMHAHIRPRT